MLNRDRDRQRSAGCHVRTANVMCALLCGVGGMLGFGRALAQPVLPEYAILQSPDVGKTLGTLRDISDPGIAVGSEDQIGGQLTPLVVYPDGRFEFLDLPPGAAGATVLGVNEVGEAFGDPPTGDWIFWEASGEPHLVDTDGLRHDFNAINAHGEVAGGLQDPSTYIWTAIVWSLDNGVRTLPDLDPNSDVYAFARGINDDGLVVGRADYWDGTRYASRAVLWRDGEISQLPQTPREKFAETALHINRDGVILGEGSTGGGRTLFVWLPDGRVLELDDGLQGKDVSANGLTDSGVVLGSNPGNGTTGSITLVWFDLRRRAVQLQTMLPPQHQWHDLTGWGINNLNQIAGQGRIVGRPLTELRGFIATPVTPTFTLHHPVPGQAGEVNTFTIEGAPPNTEIVLVAGLHGGGAYIPGCTTLDNVLQIDNPQFLGRVRSDANGNVTLRRKVPASHAGKTYVFQAVIPSQCAISTLMEQTF